MKNLLLLRHAKSDWGDESLPDHDRPLNARGKVDAPRMGQLLRDMRLAPELVLSSTAKRARKTADKVLQAGGFAVELQLVEDLYLATVGAWVRVLQALPDGVHRVLAVGHNPGIEDFVHVLTGCHTPMPTAALADIELPIEEWSELSLATRGTLRHFWAPKELED